MQELEARLADAQARRVALEEELAAAQRRSDAAARTIAAVTREVTRWKANAEVQDRRHAEVCGARRLIPVCSVLTERVQLGAWPGVRFVTLSCVHRTRPGVASAAPFSARTAPPFILRKSCAAAQVLGEVLLCAATLSYLGPVSGSLRAAVEEDWQASRAAHCTRPRWTRWITHRAPASAYAITPHR